MFRKLRSFHQRLRARADLPDSKLLPRQRHPPPFTKLAAPNKRHQLASAGPQQLPDVGPNRPEIHRGYAAIHVPPAKHGQNLAKAHQARSELHLQTRKQLPVFPQLQGETHDARHRQTGNLNF
jgi:hypothetical protein